MGSKPLKLPQSSPKATPKLEGPGEVGLAVPPLLPVTALSGASSSSASSSSPSKYSSSSSAANRQPKRHRGATRKDGGCHQVGGSW